MDQPPTGHYNRASLWWRHEHLHRGVLSDYPTRLAIYRANRDKMEADFLAAVREERHKPAAERAAFVARCFDETDRATLHWAEMVDAIPTSKKLPRGYEKIWQKLTKEAAYNFGFRADFTSSPGG